MKRTSQKPSRLSESVHHQLNSYALAASVAGVGILALAQPAEARIIYTPAHIKLAPNHDFLLDLNHDGIKDFELDNNAVGSYASLDIHALQTGNAPAQANTGCNPGAGVAALQAGVLIGKGQVFYPLLYCMAQKLATEGSFGSWPGVRNRYLGLQFVIKGKKHFAWARLSVSYAPYVATLTGYAYETIPGKAIIAGKTKGTDDSTAEQPNPASLSAPTPEPSTLGLLALGAPGLSIWRREESVTATPERN
jgi:hypothetical protein